MLHHLLDPADRLNRSDQYRRRKIRRLGDQIEHVVESVDKVNIGVARRAEHHIRPLGSSLGRVTSKIMRAKIGFGLNDPPGQNTLFAPMHEKFA